MSGPPNMYQGGYPNNQQPGIRPQQYPGMMAQSQQVPGMMSPQQYGPLQNQQTMQQQLQSQQAMQQQLQSQQAMQQQMQSQQAMHQQMQSQQAMQQQMQSQQAMQQQMQSQQAMHQQMQGPNPMMTPGQMQMQLQQQQAMQMQPQLPVQPLPQQQQGPTQQQPQLQPPSSQQAQVTMQQQQQQAKEINTASLCRLGQETVSDIVNRTQEVFQTLKVIQPPNGTAQGMQISADKKNKVNEQLRAIRLLFKRLRIVYERCTENCVGMGMEYTHVETFIPMKSDTKENKELKIDEKKNSEAFRQSTDEYKEIIDQVIAKNRHLKEVIDNMRRIICEINTMLAMRRS